MIDAVLRGYWPGETQTLLLTAAIGAPAEASAAWQEWLTRRNLDEVRWPEVRLLATVARRAAQFNNPPALRRIQGIQRYVWTRTQMCLAKSHSLLAALGNAPLQLMLIKGGARLALEPASDRFINDVDILVHLEHWRDALEVVHRAGWRGSEWMLKDKSLELDIFPHHNSVDFRKPGAGHLAGSVDLHCFALLMCRNRGDDDGLWARAVPAALQGIRCWVPSPTDRLLLTLAHGLLFDLYPVADWALDASALVRSGTVDWDLLERETATRELDPYIASTLTFLSERLRVDIPSDMLARVTARVREPFLSEFQAFATQLPHASVDEATIDYLREAASLRACKAADCADRAQASRPKRALAPLAWKRLPPEGSSKIVEIPNDLSPRSLLRLEVSFTMVEVPPGKRAGIEIAAPGLVLKRWLSGQADASVANQFPKALIAIKGWSSSLTGPFGSAVRLVLRKASTAAAVGGNWWYRVTRRPNSIRQIVNFEVPAGLFAKRGIRTITVRAVGRWLIEDVSVCWLEHFPG